MLQRFVSLLKRGFHGNNDFPNLHSNVLEVRSLEYLKQAMGWKNAPVLGDENIYNFQYLEDLNGRRIRDAEVIGSACCNGNPKILAEIGTSHGRTTALMASNAIEGKVYTVNIHPSEISKGGKNTTFAPSLDEIGIYYKKKGCDNVEQILANTLNWEPDFGPIDVAFIDGCHDADFVYNDTKKILRYCRPGSIIMWHDFAIELARVYSWINDVCQGIERLYAEGLIKGRILHLQDSWIGIYKIPEDK